MTDNYSLENVKAISEAYASLAQLESSLNLIEAERAGKVAYKDPSTSKFVEELFLNCALLNYIPTYRQTVPSEIQQVLPIKADQLEERVKKLLEGK